MFRFLLPAVSLVASLLALAAPAHAQPSTCNGRSLTSGGTIVPQNNAGTVQGSVTSSQGVYYTVTAAASASYTFTFCSNGGSSNYDSWLCLFNSSGVLITQNDDSCGLSSQIISQLAAGTYYIAVSGFSSSSGSYTLAYVAPGVNPNAAPAAPANLEQASAAAGPALPSGSVASGTVFFRATLSDTNAADTVGMTVEVLPAAVAFQSGITGTVTQTPAGSMVASGQVSEVSLSGLSDGAYHWRARAFDNNGATSGFTLFGAGTNFYIDTVPPSAPSGPLSPTGQTFNGGSGSASVTINWGAATDTGPALPLTYILDISTDPTFTNIADTIVTGTLSHSANFGASAATTYWRVSAMDAAGNQGPFVGGSFKVEAEEPEEPEEDILPCAAGVAPVGLTPLMGLLIAGTLLIRRFCRR